MIFIQKYSSLLENTKKSRRKKKSKLLNLIKKTRENNKEANEAKDGIVLLYHEQSKLALYMLIE